MEKLLLLGAGLAAFGAWMASSRGPRLALAIAGDEDVKIAPGSFSPARSAEDSAQAEAEFYLRQKKAGNIDRARALGETYARGLLAWVGESTPEAAADEREKTRLHHRLLLYSYGINRVIAERSPNSILAQTTLNVFYDEVATASPEISAHIKDMAAFSLYILVDRSRHRSEDEIGRIFAQLCGADEDPALIAEGDRVYRESCEAAAREIDAVAYDEI